MQIHMWQQVKNYYHLFQALLAAIIFNFPSNKIKVIGVTGTDGKTTTVHMIYEILKESGQKVSMVSSVGAKIGSKTYDTGFHVTTPSSFQIQKYLRKAQDAGHKYFILETTSHGLNQNRLAYVNFEIGVLTNITHDHLDYHGTWGNYAASKAKLFKNVAYSILNLDDDKSFSFLQNKASGQIISYGIKNGADVNLKNFPLKLKIGGNYNLENALASATAALALGISKQKIARALAKFSHISGRMEEVNLRQNFRVVIDFAHTPNGLLQALKALKPQRPGRLIAVFGAAGQRDKTKRPIMGSVAAENANIIILTAEDPRNDSALDSARERKRGIKNKTEGKNLFVIEDREKAIGYAINLAVKNDTVGIFGKGHEKSMAYGLKETPWDEFKVAGSATRRRVNDKKK